MLRQNHKQSEILRDFLFKPLLIVVLASTIQKDKVTRRARDIKQDMQSIKSRTDCSGENEKWSPTMPTGADHSRLANRRCLSKEDQCGIWVHLQPPQDLGGKAVQ